MIRKIKDNKFIIIGILLILIGLGNYIYNVCNNRIIEINETNLVNEYIKYSSLDYDNTNNSSEDDSNIDYLMVLEVPKINLKRGIYDINSENNTVSKNIQILKESNMPDEINGNTLFVGHNGNSTISYFNKLKNLVIGDYVIVYYNGIKYSYIISDIYEVYKTGEVSIKRDYSRSTITLITCISNTNKQIVYIAYLDSTLEY